MKKVNEYMVRSLLGPLIGTGDKDDSESFGLFKINENDEIQVKTIIRQYILKSYHNKSEQYKSSVKESLAYFLTTKSMDFGYHYDSCLIAVDHPNDPRDFFIWIWEVLFSEEDYHISDTQNYIEVNDINEPYTYL